MLLGEILSSPNKPQRTRDTGHPTPPVDGGVNPRKSGDDRKAGTRFAACDQPLLAIYRSDANGCPVALCQRRQPPKAGAVGQRLQRVAGQPSLTIKSDGWFPVAAGPPDPRAALCEDDLDSGTDSAPFMRGFSPPPTVGCGPAICRRPKSTHVLVVLLPDCAPKMGQTR